METAYMYNVDTTRWRINWQRMTTGFIGWSSALALRYPGVMQLGDQEMCWNILLNPFPYRLMSGTI